MWFDRPEDYRHDHATWRLVNGLGYQMYSELYSAVWQMTYICLVSMGLG